MKKSTVAIIAAATSAVTTAVIMSAIKVCKKSKDIPHRIIIGGSLGDLLNALYGGCSGDCDECEEKETCEFCANESGEDRESVKEELKKEATAKHSFTDATFYA